MFGKVEAFLEETIVILKVVFVEWFVWEKRLSSENHQKPDIKRLVQTMKEHWESSSVSLFTKMAQNHI